MLEENLDDYELLEILGAQEAYVGSDVMELSSLSSASSSSSSSPVSSASSSSSESLSLSSLEDSYEEYDLNDPDHWSSGFGSEEGASE